MNPHQLSPHARAQTVSMQLTKNHPKYSSCQTYENQPHYNLLITKIYFCVLSGNWMDPPWFSPPKVLITTYSKCWKPVEPVYAQVLELRQPVYNSQRYFSLKIFLRKEGVFFVCLFCLFLFCFLFCFVLFSTSGHLLQVPKIWDRSFWTSIFLFM